MAGTPGRAVVVGASGFLGSALVTALEARGIPTTSFTRSFPALGADNRPHPDLLDAETIFWTASTINPMIAENEPARVEADRDLLRSALTALNLAKSSARFVQVSSGGTVYDPAASPPYAEDAPVAPKGAYGRAKLALERVIREVRPGSVVVRAANAYGAGQPLAPGQGVLGHWLRSARDGRAIQMYGAASTSRDYVHVQDVASGLVAVHGRPEVPPVINLGSGRATTLAELLDVIRDVCGDVGVEVHPARSFDLERTWLDISTARSVLGWVPQVCLREGIVDMWDWLRANAAR